MLIGGHCDTLNKKTALESFALTNANNICIPV